jgi:hypothetical protein
MPPFNFGQQFSRSFTQSFQAAQDRQQQRKRQRALQRFRRRRLEHLSEKARKQRQLQRERMTQQRELEQRRLDQQEEAQEFRQGQAVAELMQQMYQNAQDARFRDRRLDQQERRLDLREQRINAQTGGRGIQVTNDDFANMNPLGEGQSVRLGTLPKPLQASYLRSQRQGQTDALDVNIFTDQGGGQGQGQQVPGAPAESDVQEAPSFTEQALTGKFGGGAQAAAVGLKGVGEAADAVSNFFQTSAPDSVQQEAASAVKGGVRELKKIANLPPSQRTKAAARLTTQLGKVDQALAGYQQSEKMKQTRKRLRDLRRAVGRVTPGSGQTRKIQQGLQRGLDKQLTLLEEAESLDEVNAAMKNMRKMVSQNVVGSQ